MAGIQKVVGVYNIARAVLEYIPYWKIDSKIIDIRIAHFFDKVSIYAFSLASNCKISVFEFVPTKIQHLVSYL